ncbi:hypothetical protein KXD40_005554 [Peronospora effusa]|uniref:Uncharacterized protein n=1 Tax=Peronospora effusa TaxID=542832 RepID=A0A3M6VJW1_9STRA|nr:hypothetical protein DD238_006422 [Peronospora effusa]RQM13997.1 hypothetical protein DD237_006533 [Peronospora effusa]UIZ27388.1 hypothetical protein KXD40_005554 [Peronospora effusa]
MSVFLLQSAVSVRAVHEIMILICILLHGTKVFQASCFNGNKSARNLSLLKQLCTTILRNIKT